MSRHDEIEQVRHQPLGIASIVLWQITMLHRRGRIATGLENPSMQRLLSRLHVWELTPGGVPLLTRDRKLRASKVVPLAAVGS